MQKHSTRTLALARGDYRLQMKFGAREYFHEHLSFCPGERVSLGRRALSRGGSLLGGSLSRASLLRRESVGGGRSLSRGLC